MRIGVLSRRSSIFSTRRLVEAATERGHEATVVDYLRCYMNITSKRPRVLVAGKELHFDAVVPRIGATYTFYGTAVVRQFEMMHVPSANDSQAISRARDKLRSLQLLSRAGLGMPVTGFAHSTKDIDGLLEAVGRPPYVIKLLEGTQGVGVVLAETIKAAESVIAAFRQLDANILVQRFIEEAGGIDVRVLVVGGRVVAAMERVAAEGEFRANLHRGGRARSVELTHEEAEISLAATQTLGLDVAGVDLLRSSAGPLVIEVNASPGLEGIESASGVDVASSIIEFLETRRSAAS
jgi:ribosomal protein S6--L-glutamate ligase